MENEEQGKKLAGQGNQQIDRSASGLQFQKYQMDTTARGVNGLGRRAAVDPNSLFSHPLSSGQFSGGTNARATVSAGPEGGM